MTSHASAAAEARQSKVVRILLVENNPGDVYLLEQALHHQKIAYELSCYQDGEKAIEALNKDEYGDPDLVLLDLNLPRCDGFDVLKVVRGKPGLVGIPVGILTSSSAPKDRHRGALMGADRYIHKPTTLEEFVDQVGGAIAEMLLRVRANPPGSDSD